MCACMHACMYVQGGNANRGLKHRLGPPHPEANYSDTKNQVQVVFVGGHSRNKTNLKVISVMEKSRTEENRTIMVTLRKKYVIKDLENVNQ